ncbi:MAG TPA: glycosyltransferase family 39 protein [Acetobacteraceae bacterium]|nr:glycosyltransferase family 39 protein [Acetobacteraceae bacterium]
MPAATARPLPRASRAMDDDAFWRPGGVAMAAFLLLFVAAWTAFGSLAFAGKALHGDVAEAYAWGREFRLGYNQHPPFWAWIAGGWFLVFPRQDWAFNLLAVVNAAAGLCGAWRLIGLFVHGPRRMAAFLLLLLTPFYTFLCFKYNANTIFLSLWPWTLFFFVRCLERQRRADAVWFGVMLGLSFLSKYYAIVLAGTCFAASLTHPRRATYWRSALPWISGAVCFLVFLPHLLWLISTTAPPVEYAESLVGRGWAKALTYAASFIVAAAAYQAAVLAVIAAAAWRAPPQPARVERLPMLAALVLAPVGLTVLFGLALQLKISTNMALGTFPLAPVLLLELVPRADPRRVARIAAAAAAAVTLVPLLAAYWLAPVMMRRDSDPAEREPRRELAEVATRLWHERIGTRLRLVAGTDPFENSISFYSQDAPSSFIGFSYVKAPWASPQRIARDGLLAACRSGDGACLQAAARFATPRTERVQVTLVHRFRGEEAAPMTFDLFLIPPSG